MKLSNHIWYQSLEPTTPKYYHHTDRPISRFDRVKYEKLLTGLNNSSLPDAVLMQMQYWAASVDERLFFLVARLHCLVLYENIVFVFLANKYSFSLSLSLSLSLSPSNGSAGVIIVHGTLLHYICGGNNLTNRVFTRSSKYRAGSLTFYGK